MARSTVSILKQHVCVFRLLQWSPSVHKISQSADPLSLINAIHKRKMKAGVAISPDTPSTAITDKVAAAADMLLVMTVYPGISSVFSINRINRMNSTLCYAQAEGARNS